MKKEKLLHSLIIVVIIGVVAGAGFFVWRQLATPSANPLISPSSGVKAFTSAQDFTAYVDTTYGLDKGATAVSTLAQRSAAANPEAAGSPTPDRPSSTNVQVPGIDEPDIVKTDGTNLYVSSETQYFYNFEKVLPLDSQSVSPTGVGGAAAPAKPGIIQPEPVQSTTKIIQAQPPASLANLSSIETSGNLLLDRQTLVIFTGQKVTGYNVANPAQPAKLWTADLGDNTLIAARQRLGKIYIVTQAYIRRDQPCPLAALTVDGRATTVPCAEIYHPLAESPVDTTYTAMILDPQTGQVEQKISFVGTAATAVVYMSDQALYLTSSVYADPVITQYDFLTQTAKDLVPASVQDKIRRLQTYDISRQAKLVEIQLLLDAWQSSLTSQEQTKVQQALNDRLLAYQRQHQRQLETTTIVKIGLTDMAVKATGAVPGHILNQYAIDEYHDVLRLATTSNAGLFGSGDSVNDVYTLGPDLKLRGQLRDLGQGETITSARFVNNTAYLVTFKQTDPFFVLDLADPAQPRQVGELKLPGFSSYLHPLGQDLILGIGQEADKAKASLFDVGNPSQPIEVSKLVLDDGWSEVQSNPHAFLQDASHTAVFLPAGSKGEILGYGNKTLSLIKTVDGIQARRAVYINDALYVIGQDAIVVLDERTWEQVKELGL